MSPSTSAGPETHSLSARISSVAKIERVRQWKPFLLAGFALFLGIAAGIGLTYAFVIVPRARELRLTRPGNYFFRSFDPSLLINGLAAEVSSNKAKPDWISHGYQDQYTLNPNVLESKRIIRTYETTVGLTPAERVAFQARLSSHLSQGMLKHGIGVGAVVGPTPTEQFSFGINGMGATGGIYVWCIAREQDVRVIVIMVED